MLQATETFLIAFVTISSFILLLEVIARVNDRQVARKEAKSKITNYPFAK